MKQKGVGLNDFGMSPSTVPYCDAFCPG